jgi:hypothetical protein
MLTWRIGCKESSMVNSRELDAYKKIGYVPVGIKTRIGLYQNQNMPMMIGV